MKKEPLSMSSRRRLTLATSSPFSFAKLRAFAETVALTPFRATRSDASGRPSDLSARLALSVLARSARAARSGPLGSVLLGIRMVSGLPPPPPRAMALNRIERPLKAKLETKTSRHGTTVPYYRGFPRRSFIFWLYNQALFFHRRPLSLSQMQPPFFARRSRIST